MDETLRTLVAELSEVHWKRFETALDARLAAHDLKMEQSLAVLKAAFAVNTCQRFAVVDPYVAAIDARFDRFEATLDRLFDEQLRLMVVLWLATVIPLGGLTLVLFSTLP